MKELKKQVDIAYEELYNRKGYHADDIELYRGLIDATDSFFKKAVVDNVIPGVMRERLEKDTFIFSALKTNAQLLEVSRMLLDDEGKLKPFTTFSMDVSKIKANYNQNYLEAEYQFAVSSSQQAANWEALDNSERYNIQYRTATDEKVRNSHAALHDVTLPKEDPFWNNFYPPNGWRCRCRAVEVLVSKYPTSSSAVAMELGNTATTQYGKDGANRLEIFRFNPGQKQVVFPPAHPYNKVEGAAKVKEAAADIQKK